MQLSDWKALPRDKPFASGYLKMFGQELLFGRLDKDTLQSVLQVSFQKHHQTSIKNIKMLFLPHVPSLLLNILFQELFFVISINQGKEIQTLVRISYNHCLQTSPWGTVNDTDHDIQVLLI